MTSDGSIEKLKRRIREAFAAELATRPGMSLRSADSVESFGVGVDHDAAGDEETAAYFEHYGWGITHLDAASWRHYVPLLAQYALDFPPAGDHAVRGLIESLRPPDRTPPRLGSLAGAQAAVMREVLEVLASSPSSGPRELARKTLEEWSGDEAIRPPEDGGGNHPAKGESR